MNKKTTLLLLICTTLTFSACRHRDAGDKTATPATDYTQVQVPAFSPDSAYRYVAEQLAFGMRTPGSKGWQQCGDYIVSNMRRWCDTLIEQPFKATLWDGSVVPGRNVIASINPHADRRILLAAHWDSRMWADHDPDESQQHQPVPGANDGASGVALLMEMARIMSSNAPDVGIDFIFFDVEDQGVPDWSEVYADDSWCKGSQYWSRNRHIPYYTAVYGILFDMVGTQQPRFTKEQVSRHYAPGLTDKLWAVAAALGYDNIFVNQATDPILDDHLYINQLAGIPCADIVQNSPQGSFFTHWHTTTDDLDAVNPQTLAIVANVVMKTLYSDFPSK